MWENYKCLLKKIKEYQTSREIDKVYGLKGSVLFRCNFSQIDLQVETVSIQMPAGYLVVIEK